MSESQPQQGQGWQLDDLDPEQLGESVVGGEEAATLGKPELHQRKRLIPVPMSAVERLKRRTTDLYE